ncbi:MAG: tRNA threonylcarbamoyladenosine dehydratase [Clostridia bacterium]|nr:tRNA threonylcarbamoyladenosine dehydratase [Clostridia bacterium]
MEDLYSRTKLAFKEDGVNNLKNAHVAVFGLGGVGSFLVESLVRSGVSAVSIFDGDEYSESNLNRQLFATTLSVGRKKVDAAKERLLQINPLLKVYTYDLFVDKNSIESIDFSKFNYVADAIDTISSKVEIIKKARQNCVPVISAMGAGNKLDATAFKVADISKTKVCPLAKIMRKLLKEQGIENVKVVYSEEEPIANFNANEPIKKGEKTAIASVSFVPSVMGLIMSGEIIKDLAFNK